MGKDKLQKEILQRAHFIGSYVAGDALPQELPEVVFLGRSNAGKSSLLAALIHNSTIVKTSGRPGSTQTINYFQLGKIHCVDLPGYGYARASHSQRNKLMNSINYYFENTHRLQCGFLLLDCNRLPENEELKIAKIFKENRKPLWLLLSKSDRLNQKKKALVRKNILPFESLFFNILFISAKNNEGLGPLFQYMASLGVSD